MAWYNVFGEKVTSAHMTQLPRGVLGDYKQVTSNQAAIGTSPTALTGLSETVTVPADRLLKISGQVQGNTSTTAEFICWIYEDGAAIGRVGKSTPVNGTPCSMSGFALSEPSAGSHTYDLRMETSTGTVTMEAAAVAPAHLLIEDLGGV